MLKKLIALSLALAFAFSLAACSTNGGEPAATISGTSAEVLKSVLEGSTYETEIMLGEEAVSAETCEGTLGISADVYSANVTDATLSYAMISSVAHMCALLRCNSAEAAKTVRDAIVGGFNIGRWVCVIPEETFATSSGEYVFFVSSFTDYADALLESFKTVAGDTELDVVNIGE